MSESFDDWKLRELRRFDREGKVIEKARRQYMHVMKRLTGEFESFLTHVFTARQGVMPWCHKATDDLTRYLLEMLQTAKVRARDYIWARATVCHEYERLFARETQADHFRQLRLNMLIELQDLTRRFLRGLGTKMDIERRSSNSWLSAKPHCQRLVDILPAVDMPRVMRVSVNHPTLMASTRQYKTLWNREIECREPREHCRQSLVGPFLDPLAPLVVIEQRSTVIGLGELGTWIEDS